MTSLALLEPRAAYALWAENYPPRAHNAVMLAEERAMLELMPKDLRAKHVIDAGCGSGRYMLHALRRGAAHVCGVDLSPEMLRRAARELAGFDQRIQLLAGDLVALPLPDACADLTICALAVGHLRDLHSALRELHRVTCAGGKVLCSDVHPAGHALGWRRDFKRGGERYAIRHTPHSPEDWRAACARIGFRIECMSEPMLDPRDIPHGAHFDRRALDVPVALVFRLSRLS